jgi:hypothetical protein
LCDLVVEVVREGHLRRLGYPLDVARLQERLVVEFWIKLGLDFHKFRKVQWSATIVRKHTAFVLDRMAHSTETDDCTPVAFAWVANYVVWVNSPLSKVPFWPIANRPSASPAAVSSVLDEGLVLGCGLLWRFVGHVTYVLACRSSSAALRRSCRASSALHIA